MYPEWMRGEWKGGSISLSSLHIMRGEQDSEIHRQASPLNDPIWNG